MELYKSHNDIIANDVTILGGSFRNFAGEKKTFKGKVMNDEGKRNFCMIVDPEFVPILEAEHVNVKYLKKRDDDDFETIPEAYVKVNVNVDGKYPPNIYRVTGKTKQKMSPKKLYQLDGAYFDTVDLRLNIYHADSETSSLWLNDGYFTLHVDPITAKYADFSEIGGEDYDNSNDEEDVPFT